MRPRFLVQLTTVLVMVLAGLAGMSGPAAAKAGAFGPFHPVGDSDAYLKGGLTVSGKSFQFTRAIGWTSGEKCLVGQARWSGRSDKPNDIHRCGNAGGEFTATASGSPVPTKVEVRVCLGTGSPVKPIASTCSAWQVVHGRTTSTPKTKKRSWGPVRAGKKRAVGHGRTVTKGRNVVARIVLRNRARGSNRCAWARWTAVRPNGTKSTHRTKACGARKRTTVAFTKTRALRVKICSGSKRKIATRTCSKSRRIA